MSSASEAEVGGALGLSEQPVLVTQKVLDSEKKKTISKNI